MDKFEVKVHYPYASVNMTLDRAELERFKLWLEESALAYTDVQRFFRYSNATATGATPENATTYIIRRDLITYVTYYKKLEFG